MFEEPKRIAARLGGGIDWCVAGGWAVDLFLGRETRAHEDLDVAVFRRDQARLREIFPGSTWLKLVGDARLPWDGEWLDLPIHQLFGSGIEVLLQEADGNAWRFRRDPAVSMPLSEARLRSFGVPILNPAIVLLFKAKAPRPKDEHDFRALLPALSDPRLAWLRAALERCHPGHAWLRAGR